MSKHHTDNFSISPQLPAKNTSSQIVTKAYSLTREDVLAIETVKQEEALLSDSAALRRLIRDGQRFRDSRRRKESESDVVPSAEN